MTENGAAPTSVAAWAGPQTRLVTLPSGNVARLRDKLPVYMLLRTGQFSEDLFAAFEQWQRGELSDPKLAADLLDLIVETMFVDPSVSRTPGPYELGIDQITEEDIDFVLEGAVGGSPDGAFREDGTGVGDSGSGEDVGGAAVSDAGDDPGDAAGAEPRPAARRAPARARGTTSKRSS